MTATEYERWQHELATDYAADQVAAGNWPVGGAYERAREEDAARLPQGAATDGMLTLIGMVDGEPIGRLWIGLAHPRGVPDCAFLYDIEVAAGHRGRGLGRALLAAGEAAARERGAHALELNVFGANPAAADLYRTSGYQVTTQQMRKDLRRATPRFAPSHAYERAAFAGDPGELAAAERRLAVQEAETCLSRAKIAHARFLTGTDGHDEELSLLDRSVTLFRRAGDVTGEAEALGWTGIFHQVVRQDDAAATPYLRRAAESGDPLTRSFALRHLGVAAHRAGNLPAARELLEESTALRREHGFPVGVAANLVGLIYIAAAEGRDITDMATEARALATAAGATTILAQVDEAARAATP